MSKHNADYVPHPYRAAITPAELRALKAAYLQDKARLDWLECQRLIGIDHQGYGDFTYYANDTFPNIREVCDREIAKEKTK